MAKEKKDDLKEKKKELQAELKRIQDELDDSLDEVREDVSHSLRPSEIIKKYPLPSVGVSVLLGFLLSHSNRSASGSGRSGSRNGFTGLLFSELKKIATKKAINAATDYIDEFIDGKKEEALENLNGTERDGD
ncbi:MAG: hypothetical protein U5K69_26120 [Balneolaceae bacterium]|nr:hypothetical protein [Balneolaceae bacterium]